MTLKNNATNWCMLQIAVLVLGNIRVRILKKYINYNRNN